MDWRHASVVLDRFEQMSRVSLKELKQHYRQIQQLESERDHEGATIEKNNAKKLVDNLLAGLHKILVVRNDLSESAAEMFDSRLEPTRLQIQSIISALDKLLREERKRVEHDQHRPSTSLNNNPFDDCFTDDTQPPSTNVYENHLFAQAQLNPKAEEMRLRAEQAKMDAEASQKLAEEIEDLNQVMLDLSQLVHNQHELVDSIEEHIERSNQEVQAGHQQLRKAVKSNNAKYPLMTAIAGSVAIGGPVGIAAGSAVAGVAAAVGGAFAGLYGGRAIKKQVQKEATRE